MTTFINILWSSTRQFWIFSRFYLQEENPSREHTILRTAQKLKPFSFNKFSANGYHDFLPSRLRPKFQNIDANESTFSEILCLICGSPFSESELQNLENTKHKAQKKIDLFTAHCCQSCHFQILPAATDMYGHFFSLLPKFWTEKVDTASASHSSLRWGWRIFLYGLPHCLGIFSACYQWFTEANMLRVFLCVGHHIHLLISCLVHSFKCTDVVKCLFQRSDSGLPAGWRWWKLTLIIVCWSHNV